MCMWKLGYLKAFLKIEMDHMTATYSNWHTIKVNLRRRLRYDTDNMHVTTRSDLSSNLIMVFISEQVPVSLVNILTVRFL